MNDIVNGAGRESGRARFPFSRVAGSAWSAWRSHSARRRTYQALMAMDDHRLADIGITRGDLMRL